jgi:exopolyphosphatase/pppGpp-phosphohydrolase
MGFRIEGLAPAAPFRLRLPPRPFLGLGMDKTSALGLSEGGDAGELAFQLHGRPVARESLRMPCFPSRRRVLIVTILSFDMAVPFLYALHMPYPVVLLDLGSNAVRFVHAEITPGVGYRILKKARAQTRLGGGVNGHLRSRAVRETLQAVHGFLQSLPREEDFKVLAVATAALRDAENRDALLEPLRRDTGIEVSILSGHEEAQLGAIAALRTFPLANGLIIDLGGGSLQVSEVRSRSATAADSFPLGAVRMTERFLHHDPPLPGEVEKLRREIRRHLAGALPARRDYGEMVGLGGTVRAVARIHLGLETGQDDSRQGLRLARADVTSIRSNLQGLSLGERSRLPGVKAERVDIILAGAVVLEELMILADYPALTVCKNGVRDGILLHEAFRSNGGAPSRSAELPPLSFRPLPPWVIRQPSPSPSSAR